MTKTILNSICISLVSLFAVACGDPGGAPLDPDPELGDVLAGDPGAENGDTKVDDNDDGAINDDGGQPNDGGEEPDPGISDPICGDGVLDATEQCDDGNTEDGDGCSSACQAELEGQISIDLVVDSLISNEAPLGDACSGTIALETSNGTINGEGRCFLDANANVLDYVLHVQVDTDGAVTGEVEVVLNGTPHVLTAEGTLENGSLFVAFDGVTLATQNIRILWNGEVEATLN